MSQPQGSMFDTAYIDSLTKQVEDIDVCSQLQAFIDKEVADLKSQLSAMEDQLSALGPIADLLESPSADIAKIVSWISDFITGVLKPMYQPVVTLAKQIEETIAAVTKLEAAVAAKAAEIANCVVNLPSTAVSSVTEGED